MSPLDDPARRDLADELFADALDRHPPERSAWLDARCADDPELRAEVEELLRAHEMAGGILDVDMAAEASVASGPGPGADHRPGRPSAARSPDSPAEARHVGPYRLLRELGRGGMGVVYLAERDDGQFRRRVAIKLLRGAAEGDELRDRFRAERQILASLDHPNIARLLDAGVADGQLPYLVMEYVDGIPLTEYCDRRRLGIEPRLRLFQDVCAAVHHAHRNLVLHRDLKPGNILVTQAGGVKLLDFGIAKLLNPGLSAMAMPVTRTGVRVLTPEYASPEQLRGESLSTASDVYALGVILYELLAGCRPGDAEPSTGGSDPGFLNYPGERRVARPSAAVAAGSSAVAAARASTPEHLCRTLRGDLDAIILMALRAESDRRYGSADLLMEDIHRHLEGLPVLAHRGSRRYYVGKFMRRHRAAVIITATAVVSLVTGAGTALWQASIARAERDRADAARVHAEAALSESEAVTGFLVGLFEASDPAESAETDVTARDLLRRGAARIERLSDQPLVQARVMDAVARVYLSIGKPADARALAERALAVRRARLGEDDIEVARTRAFLADVARRQGRYPEAEALAREALRIEEEVLGSDDPEVAAALVQLSGLTIYRGDLAAADTLARRALAIQENAPQPDDSLVITSLVHLAAVIRRLGEYDEAEGHLRRAIAIAERRYGPEHPFTAVPMNHLAYLNTDLGRLDEADSLLARVVDIRRRTVGAGHPSYAYTLGDLAEVLSARGDHARAVAMFREEMGILRRTYGHDFANLAPLLGTISRELALLGRLEEADAAVEEALVLARRDWGEDHQMYGDLLVDRARVRRLGGRTADAEADLRRGIEIRSRANGPRTRNVAMMRAALGSLLLDEHRYDEARSELTAALVIFRASRTPEQDARVQAALSDLAAVDRATL